MSNNRSAFARRFVVGFATVLFIVACGQKKDSVPVTPSATPNNKSGTPPVPVDPNKPAPSANSGTPATGGSGTPGAAGTSGSSAPGASDATTTTKVMSMSSDGLLAAMTQSADPTTDPKGEVAASILSVTTKTSGDVTNGKQGMSLSLTRTSADATAKDPVAVELTGGLDTTTRLATLTSADGKVLATLQCMDQQPDKCLVQVANIKFTGDRPGTATVIVRKIFTAALGKGDVTKSTDASVLALQSRLYALIDQNTDAADALQLLALETAEVVNGGGWARISMGFKDAQVLMASGNQSNVMGATPFLSIGMNPVSTIDSKPLSAWMAANNLQESGLKTDALQKSLVTRITISAEPGKDAFKLLLTAGANSDTINLTGTLPKIALQKTAKPTAAVAKLVKK